jgi:formamidopyrimidine-DNA glycosylase
LLIQPAAVLPISDLGPDALLEPMTVDEFAESLSKKKIAIKALLLDQVKAALLTSLAVPKTIVLSNL